MSWFIKRERFKSSTNNLPYEKRKYYINKHKKWVKSLINSGIKVSSGYLVDNKNQPGGGGILILKADSFEMAEDLIKQDPIILAELVDWTIQEWIPVSGNLLS